MGCFFPACGCGGDECAADLAVDVGVRGLVVLVEGGAGGEGEWASGAGDGFG